MDGTDGEVFEVLQVPLLFEVPGRSLHCPMVSATVSGVETKLIVDTGVTTQVFTIDLVDQAGLDRAPNESGTDVAGNTVTSWDLPDPTIGIGGTSFLAAHAAAIAGPPPFAEWGVGGFLSPQALWPDNTVVLDFARRRLLVFAGHDDAANAHIESGDGDPVILGGVHHVAGTVGIEVAVSKHEPVVAFFDSGANLTEVSITAASGELGEKAISGHSVSGAELETYELHDQVLDVGEARLPVPVLAVRDHIPVPEGAPTHEEPDAVIGMDLLGETILKISPRSRGQVSWIVPSHRRRR
ncbi:MAG TPA: aspartyl protease family protein [Acidimicrobiales bacterium]